MKKALVFAFALLVFAGVSHAELPFTVEGAANLTVGEGETRFGISGGALFDITEKIRLRATVLSLNLTEGTALYLGTGMNLDVLYSFKASKIAPYAVGGFHLNTMENFTSINLNAGGGVEFVSGKNLTPFVEDVLGIASISFGGMSESSTSVAIRGGVRFR